ncbi:hypothetical protein BH11ACT6_BH11ACT6_53380 [soil metagenome]
MALTRVSLLDDKLMTSKDVSELFGRTENALALDRYNGRGLPYVRIGRQIRYRASEVAAYLDAHTVEPSGR